MLKYYYQWRYKRSQRAGAFQLPAERRRGACLRMDLGSYLSQDAVRGRRIHRSDLPSNRGRWLRLALIIGAVLVLSWLIYESVAAFSMFRN